MKKIRTIALYLPQYHPCKENDKQWGTGHTDWNNVVKGYKRFKGHYQPHEPADLGYYDLRLPETRMQQAEIAKKYGIDGFCYYHYWFGGKRIIERPFNEVLNSKQPDFPFMLCWANESWARTWDGTKEIFMEQTYSDEDSLNHIKWLIKAFKDPRYIKIDGKPVLAIYKPTNIENIGSLMKIWQTELKKEHMNIYLCYYKNEYIDTSHIEKYFDAAIDYLPQNMKGFRKTQFRVLNKLNGILSHYKLNHCYFNFIFNYKTLFTYLLKQPLPSKKTYPCIFPSWDNCCRRLHSSFMAFKNSTPDLYKEWLEAEMRRFKPFSTEENLFFINAWNEWAEGAHLEPDRKWGYISRSNKTDNR